MTRATRRYRVDLGALAFIAVALVIYVLSNPLRSNLYNHFVWQADAFLHGRFAIEWPLYEGGGTGVGNFYFQDVLPLPDMPGFGLIPYPPLPALLVLPLVALFGMGADAALVAAIVGALNVGLAWRIARRLTRTRAQAALATIFYGFGTVAWYAAMLGSTWFLAHTVASTCLLLAIALAIGGDPGAANRTTRETATPAGRWRGVLSARSFVTGAVFGMATLARLTTILGAPFFALVGTPSRVRRIVSIAVGAALPVLLLFAYNLASSGSLFHPAYDYAYRTEYSPRPELIHPDWAPEDLRYVPQNLGIMLAYPPVVRPECGLSFFDPNCPLVQPDAVGMSLLLTSPGYLLAGGLLLRRKRPVDSRRQATAQATEVQATEAHATDVQATDVHATGSGGTANPPAATLGLAPAAVDDSARRSFERRAAAGALLSTVAIAFADIAHFSQGWVQFGYRFSNDFAPFALLLVALALGRRGVGWIALVLVAISVLVNAWGVYWGVVNRW